MEKIYQPTKYTSVPGGTSKKVLKKFLTIDESEQWLETKGYKKIADRWEKSTDQNLYDPFDVWVYVKIEPHLVESLTTSTNSTATKEDCRKWEALKEYLENTIQHGTDIKMATSQEQGFIFGFEDVLAKMDKLEAANRNDSENELFLVVFNNRVAQQIQTFRVEAKNEFRAGRAFYRAFNRKAYHDCIETIEKVR